ncbi:hypothetical protein LINGRAHAP2_LOCUS12137 [Linum grandiflorum]
MRVIVDGFATRLDFNDSSNKGSNPTQRRRFPFLLTAPLLIINIFTVNLIMLRIIWLILTTLSLMV